MTTVRVWRAALLLIMLGMLIPAGLIAQQPAEGPKSADEVLARATALVTANDYDSAVTLLKSAVERYPTETALYLTLADCQEAQALLAMPAGAADPAAFRQRLNDDAYLPLARELFETYGRATMYATDIQPVQQRVEDLVSSQFPVELNQFGPVALPGDPMPYMVTLTDPQLPTEVRGAYQGLITTRPLPVTPALVKDPKYGADATFTADPVYGKWSFSKMVLAYEYDRAQRSWRLRFRVIWQDAPGQGDARARLARYTAMLMLRLSALAHAYTGLTPRFAADGALNVWLTEKGEPGGEAFDDNIYLYSVGTPRTPTEWARELSHEYGHEILPVVGGYSKPEWGSNGLLGERLFLRWLLLNRDPKSDSHPWVASLDPQEVRDNRLYPVIHQFAALGPEAEAMRGTDRAAMDGFIGMAVYLEMTRGSQYLTSLLKGLTTPAYMGPQGFLDELTSQEGGYYQNPEHALVILRLSDLPADIPLWVYLREGTWKAEVGHGLQPIALKVDVDGKAIKTDGDTFTAPAFTRGWHSLKITADGNDAPALSELKLVRQ